MFACMSLIYHDRLAQGWDSLNERNNECCLLHMVRNKKHLEHEKHRKKQEFEINRGNNLERTHKL